MAKQVPPSAFKLSDDSLKIEVWASTPMLHNPTGMDIDADGNVWLTEAVNYRTFRNDNLQFEEGDRVSVLIDSDGDGKADKSHVFVQDKDLVAPLGVAVLDNKIYVSCSPSILVYTDNNRNLVFDEGDTKEIFLTGFGGSNDGLSSRVGICGSTRSSSGCCTGGNVRGPGGNHAAQRAGGRSRVVGRLA